MKRPKLIVSDIDGTLIPYGYGALPSDLADTVRELSRKGIAFCPASGRQYHSMRVLFHEIADEIYYISENGDFFTLHFEKYHVRMCFVAFRIRNE